MTVLVVRRFDCGLCLLVGFLYCAWLSLEGFHERKLAEPVLSRGVGLLRLTGAGAVEEGKVSNTSAFFIIRMHTLILRFGGSHCGGKESICFRKENVTAS